MRTILTCAGCKTDFWNGAKYTWLSSSTCSLLSPMLISSRFFQETFAKTGRLSMNSVRSVDWSDDIFVSCRKQRLFTVMVSTIIHRSTDESRSVLHFSKESSFIKNGI